MMLRAGTPWIGLVALLAMFVLPFLPAWLFEGPRTIRHHPRRHVCADCGEPWTDDHTCVTGLVPGRELLQGELRRTGMSAALERRPTQLSETDD
jgi:hypothetical protein